MDLESCMETLDYFVKHPDELKQPQYKGLRTMLHRLNEAKMHSGMHSTTLVGKITEHLVDGRWDDALRDLTQLRLQKIVPKLGSVQRWVRACDAASPRDGTPFDGQVLLVLDAILRAADPEMVQETKHLMQQMEPWSAFDRREHVPFQVTQQTQDYYKQKFKIVMHQKGEERRTKNVYDFTLYHSDPDTIQFEKPQEIQKLQVPNVPGAFMMTNVLSDDECNQILTASESIGYTGDAPLVGEASQQKSILAHNFFWLADEHLLSIIFERCKPHLPQSIDGLALTGLNARWRLYRYVPGAIYRPHIDGAWPASGLKDGKYHYDLEGNQRSRLTFLVYLNDEFSGGYTTYFVPSTQVGVMYAQAVVPRRGCIVCFPHGASKGSLLHEGSPVFEGTKYIIRADVLYELPEEEWHKSEQEMN
ncbi:hypothetical protein EDD86DRAFT_191293 [Gorgonomyces haynaldii]|nr:hypothetical protein EDD86DRAFT_191293 [Gorgonomyces haynaldii]